MMNKSINEYLELRIKLLEFSGHNSRYGLQVGLRFSIVLGFWILIHVQFTT